MDSEFTHVETEGVIETQVTVSRESQRYLAKWCIWNEEIETALFPQYGYSTPDQLVEKEYESRVFLSESAATTVRDELEQFDVTIQSQPEERVMGNARSEDIPVLVDTATRTAQELSQSLYPLIDYSLLLANEHQTEGAAEATHRLTIRLLHELGRYSNLVSTVGSVGRLAQQVDPKATSAVDDSLSRALLTAENVRSTMFLLVHAANKVESNVAPSDDVSSFIDTVRGTETYVHQLYRSSLNIENWRLSTQPRQRVAHEH